MSAITETETREGVADEISDLSIPDVDDFIDTPKYPSDDDLPDELKPKRTRRSKKRNREAVETITETIAMVNSMFALAVPCSCAATLPPEIRGMAHRDNCTKLYPLTEPEAEALAAAVAQEFAAHPEWLDKLANADTWMAHAMLATAIFGIVMARRGRTGARVLLPEGVTLSAEMAASLNGAYSE